jgi:hypothetical protein
MGLLSKADRIGHKEKSHPGLSASAKKGLLALAENFSRSGDIKQLVAEAAKKLKAVNGLVCEAPGNFEKIKKMISSFAVAAPLPQNRILILGPATLDCRLLAHRLAASAGGKALADFEGCAAEDALEALKPYL